MQSTDDEISEDLLKVEVEVMNIEFCNGSDSYTELMQEGMFCAGSVEGTHTYTNHTHQIRYI